MPYMISSWSVADGVSLSVISKSKQQFDITIILADGSYYQAVIHNNKQLIL